MILFDTLPDGRDVHALSLKGHGIRATVLTYGAILQDLRLDGVGHSLTLGSDDIADYCGDMRYHGAIVGPVANRISNGRTVIDGISHGLERNQDRKHTLHGGAAGLHRKIWEVRGATPTQIILGVCLPDGSDGLPGNREVTARYEIKDDGTFRLTITTTTDAASVANATNHSYWTMDGSGHVKDHWLQIKADSYLEADAEVIPTGDQIDVTGTAFDFRTAKTPPFGDTAIDHNFCLSDGQVPLREVLTLRAGALEMVVSTTEPGVQIFDDRPAYGAVVVECQGWPDAPNQPGFPSVRITPEAPMVQITQWQFRQTKG